MQTKVNESGRSLLEMIAILAIMILLVLGGLRLYGWVMIENEANVLHDDLMVRGRLKQEGRPNQKKNFSVDMENKTQLGTAIIADTEKDNGAENYHYSFMVESIRKEVCDSMIKKNYQGATRVTINDHTYAVNAAGEIDPDVVCPGELNNFKVTFNKNAGHGSYIRRICKTDHDCPSTRRCINGVCKDVCPSCGEGECCFQGSCTECDNPGTHCDQCPADKCCDGDECVVCPDDDSICPLHCCECDQDNDVCTKCKKGYHLTEAGTCVACPRFSSCPSCNTQSDFECISPFEPQKDPDACICPAGYKLDTTQKTCTPCPAGTYSADDNSTECTPCDCGTYSGSGETSCTACGEGKWAPSGSSSCQDIDPRKITTDGGCSYICPPSGTVGAAGHCQENEIANGQCGCTIPCPNAPGMTGAVDENDHCLCDTTQGYKALSVDDIFCECDTSRNYWNKPDGTCMTCAQTTKAWAIKNEPPDLDKNSVVESVWYCGYYKYNSSGDNVYYNPSTKTYCSNRFQVLEKDANGNFYCSSVCGGAFNTYQPKNRATGWGRCGCLWHSTWDGTRCVPPCNSGYAYENPKTKAIFCYPCALNVQSLTLNQCRSSYLCPTGMGAWDYRIWYQATPDSCHTADGSYSVQTDGGPCDVRLGCRVVANNLPPCEYNSRITSDCTCPTGGNIGDYCCHAAQIITSSGCQTCPRGKQPNEARNACVLICPTGKVPNADQTECVCPNGLVPDEDGTCYCPAGYGLVNGVCSACTGNTISTAGGWCAECGAGTANSTHTQCACSTNAHQISETDLTCSCNTPFALDNTNHTCYCPAGYGLSGNTCSACTGNTISKANGQCVDCGAGTANNNHTDCNCYANATHDPNTLLCSCNANHALIGGTCQYCTYGVASATSCYACQPNTRNGCGTAYTCNSSGSCVPCVNQTCGCDYCSNGSGGCMNLTAACRAKYNSNWKADGTQCRTDNNQRNGTCGKNGWSNANSSGECFKWASISQCPY